MSEPDATSEDSRLTEPADEEFTPSLDSAAALASILDRYMADLQAGRVPDRQQLCDAHPELATQLEACVAGLEFIHRATGLATETPTTLGEFRIIRELGRGGMGVVYEAEQTSLRRQVALKVLRFGVVADEEAMNRFRREAETVARLHHTNIVPIFAVGSERGVHYYAMQYIAGRSLADVLAESQRTGNPVSAEDVSRWGLQAAEALAHVHQRGVIHRDIKPSNLLLDPDGVVWLTDFGLAKRMDEATLTVHGTLMGTPRYMSPEQAASLQQPVDRRTDLYSLGASLYELATGRPLFESAIPHVVIARILTEEPARPRQIRPALPRDLETVILTCLAKEPPKRYQNAQALASDLRAVTEGRPIQARRSPWAERAVRYVRQRRKSLTGAGLATAATVLLMLGALGGWHYYSEWRLGRIVLATDGPPLAAEVLPASSGDQPMGEPFDVGTRTVLTLPAGDYRLRVKATGLMSETYRIAVNRGDTRTHHLTLDDDRLLGTESIPFSLVTEAVMLTPGKADLIEWNGETLIRRDGSTGKPVWDAARPERPWGRERDPVAAIRRLSRFGDEKRPGQLVQPATDVDGDGTGDLIWAFKGTPSLVALSGKDGSLLWTYSADPGAAVPRPAAEVLHPGQIMGAAAVADVDGDGAADLIAEFVILDDPEGLIRRPKETAGRNVEAEPVLAVRRMVVAVSGRSGKELWNYLIDRKPTDLPAEALDHGISYISQAKGSFVAVIDGSKWIGLDPATGQLRGPSINLGFTPVQPIQHADLDGDGSAEILALEPHIGFEPLTDPTLAAFSAATGNRLWVKKSLMSFYRPMPAVPVRDWPVAADLDGDGRAEIVVPNVGKVGQGVLMLDGATGENRWDCPLWPGMQYAYDSLIHLLAAPDLDADGTRDLIVVSRFSGRLPIAGQVREPSRIYVDAVSGRNGQKLWHWRTDLNHGDTTPVGSPFWWGRTPDGWPMLALPIGGGEAPGRFAKNPYFTPDPAVVHLLAAATGREAHVVEGLSRPGTADLDGDGLADLWGAVDGKVRAFRALAPQAWRALGGFQPAGDLDGDGVSDVVSNDLEAPQVGRDPKPDSGTAIARSGRDGRILWQALLDPWENRFFWGEWAGSYGVEPLKLPAGDLDGDGAPDIVVHRSTSWTALNKQQRARIRLQALSGRTGRTLWPAGALPYVDSSIGIPYVAGIDAAACKGWGRSDVFVLHHNFVKQSSIPPFTFYVQSRLARLSGRDGRLIWDVLLAEYKGGMKTLRDFVYEFADLDGDGSLEMVLLFNGKAPAGTVPFEVRVLSLATGDTRWSHPLNPRAVGSPTCVVGDLDGDKRPEVVVSEQPIVQGLPLTEVTALDGVTGTPRWVWRGSAGRDVTYQDVALVLADFDGRGRREVCVSFGVAPECRRVEILNSQGRSRGARDTESVNLPELIHVDLDGDGRDELLFRDAGRLCAVRGDLTEIWSWPTREPIREVLPASPRHAATVILSPSLGLDGATGRPTWSIDIARSFLSSSDGKSLPRALTGPDGTTICRVAMPATTDGTHSPAQGLPARPAVPGNDPRWERPLPWVGPVEPYAHPLVLLVMGATLTNICIPVAILWLATRRRFWSMRLLLALPVVVAILLTGYSAMSSLILDRPQTTMPPWWGVLFGVVLLPMGGLPIVAYATAFVLSLVRVRWLKWLLALPVVAAILVAGHSVLITLIPANAQPTSWWSTPLDIIVLSMSGLPIVAYAAALVLSLVRRRWRKTGLLIAGAVLAAVLIGAITLLFDMLLVKPLIEHYTWSGWHHAVYLGVYAVGTLVLLAWPARRVAGLVWRLARQRRGVISPPS